MRMLFLILALACGAAAAQTRPLPEPSPPMVPAIKPALGAASRHEDFARERALRTAEQAEDRADAERKEKENARRLRRTER